MQAIILAAGMGKRLKELTHNNTKCMIEVGGVTLIERMLTQLEKYHLSQIIIVVGYKGQELMDYTADLNLLTPISYINNPIYDRTNNIYSLSLAKEYLCKEDTLLFESDIIFEDSVIDGLIRDPNETLVLVDKYESWMDGTCVKLTDDDSIRAFVPGKEFNFNEIGEYYKTVNIYKFSKAFSESIYVPFLDAYSKVLGNNEYYEQVLRVIALLDVPLIKAKRLNGQRWYEIDDIQDLDIAVSMFAESDEDRVSLIQGRYGGLWRYPKLIDFCYLVNPYFPPQKLKDELIANFERLLTQYPSGMRVNSLIAGKIFNIQGKNIVVGNGAAELIKALMEELNGRIGIIQPTFEEYPNRYNEKELVAYMPDHEDFAYGADQLIDYFGDKKITCLILINPDNPSGNYIPRAEMDKLIRWTKNRNIQFVVDESFADFADEDNTFADQELLDSNQNLIVIKSISKSYGVPGLRLGILASGDVKLIDKLKKDVAIWNINSFAEFYMQIEGKYKEDYITSLVKIKKARIEMENNLRKLEGIRVITSQANYVMVEIVNGMSSNELTKRLLVRHNLLIKNLCGKLVPVDRQFIRLAVRTMEDNRKLIHGLKEELR